MDKDSGNDSRKLENVLVMQGGGSLRAYECGGYIRLFQNMVRNRKKTCHMAWMMTKTCQFGAA